MIDSQLVESVQMVTDYNNEKLALLNEEPIGGAMGEVATIVFLVMRVVVVTGALIFMWQVRHPRKGQSEK